MNKNYNIITVLFIALISFYSCTTSGGEKKVYKQAKPKEQQILVVEDIASPTENESSVSNLFVDENGAVYLTWISAITDEINTLFLSKFKNGTWQEPTKVAEGENWIVNWADFPSLTKFGDNLLVANFLVMTDEANFAYDVHLPISKDDGKTWRQPFKPHLDNTKTEHGFVSLIPYQNDKFVAVWLDGRKYAKADDAEMTLRSAIIDENGVILENFLIDDRVCDCCGTNAIATDNGIVVVYRNRSENEIRDFYTVTFNEGKWSEPKIVAADNWEINGCPTNGSAIDALNNQLVVAWYSAPNEESKVNITFSNNYGDTFSIPTQINTTQTQGRVDVCYLNEGKAAVGWMEGGFIKVRLVDTDGSGKVGKPVLVSATKGSRASGFPKMVKSGDELLFTWTETGDQNHIKTILI